MKKFFNKIAILGLGLGLMTSCTGNFETMNVDPNNPTETSPQLMFPKMLQYGYCTRSWEYQVGENLHTNQYAQYVSCTSTGFVTDRYGTNDTWVKESFWRMYYTYISRNMDYLKETLEDHPEYMNMYQVMRIYSTFVAQRTTDLFGDIPYTEAGQGIITPKYDSQESIYNNFFKELDEAIAYLEAHKSEGLATFGSQDLVYGGDYDQWIKLGNSLRLRLAIRIAYIQPDVAKAQGEKALATNNLLASTSDNAGIMNFRENNANSFYTISFWNEFRASKTIIDAMLPNVTINKSSVNDPRLPLFFSKTQGFLSGNSSVPEYRGVPNGLAASSLTQDEYRAQNNSCIWGYEACDWNSTAVGSVGENDSPQSQVYALVEREQPVMYYSEVCFLKAEAGLRGWSGAGDIKANYEAGIRASFEEAREGAVSAYTYDPNDDETYINAVKITDTGDFEGTLEKIISQKWLALYPNGVEAWSEFRRTGYPKMNLVVVNESSDIPQGQFIKKLAYINDEKSLNPNSTDASLNGGKGDGRNVRVWWDTGRYN
ncbi:SusD/RagB family nutrient-binding outer membrane lipoprotein [Parabacteroides bouchesdurhonensis]|uniref:SusD/RagB family nutrient-binding outer membrane lipoprotein n=1 Tax=Parabacteroides bouchesdurhonensis TaxID=1936995 RepID=UPI000E555CFE|nr:SusD/RagB family nutrient-binding outer membrane lipoprotein [Parabacteroides bouchesdurhonensis]RHJ93558.1 SusD/RagB family nutrient-binding outer membrane lipoprotein [Bacteroides sp. AM07-16]